MSKELYGRVAIVTGSAHGIGRAITEALLAAGAIVHGFDREGPPDVKGRRYRHRQVEVGEARELEAAVAGVIAEAGRLDALVNNAGTHPPTQTIDAFSIEDFDDLVRTNLRSVFVACRAGLPALRARGVLRVNDRRVLDVICWVLWSGASWRDLPEAYGPPTTCYNRFVHWRRAHDGWPGRNRGASGQ